MSSEKGVSRFYKVSLDQYIKDIKEYLPYKEEDIVLMYNNINLPRRATKNSAGYDFYSPFDFTLMPNESIKVPTGIRCKMNEDVVLLILPRSSLGFKYRLQLDNSVGVIDSDYFGTTNEGHIFVKITNDTKEGKVLDIKKGEAFCQGMFLHYLLTEDDEVSNVRYGGLGSTNANQP